MEEIYTCICGSQNTWGIGTDGIMCDTCGREYKWIEGEKPERSENFNTRIRKEQ
jgi:hypothetical protein